MAGRVILVALLGLLGLGNAAQCPKQRTSPGREVVCYTSTSDVDELTDSICKCTTLVRQGYDVRNLSTSGFESFRKALKEINPALQFVVSVNDPAQTLRTSGTVRQEMTARLVNILKEVDGIELNVTAGSKERLAHFVKGLKDEMVRKSYEKRLFLVLPTKSENLAKQFDLKELSKYVDLFTIATDYLTEDDESYHTFHPSRLMGLFDMINTDSLIDLISGLGVPKRKILVSVPSGAYKFTLKDQNDNAPRSPTTEKEPVIIDRKQLCDSMNKGEWTIERDEDLTAPYAFKNKTWIAFEDNISVGIKGKYALLRDLPGLAIRDIERDLTSKCGKPVTHEIHHSFTDFKRKSRAAVLTALEDDLHQAQLSYPNQVKSSDFRVVRVVDTEGHIRVVRENTQTEFTCTRQGYFVHPKSCNRFYRCVKFNQEVEDYSVFEFDCPAGLAFDERTEVCVWPGSLPQGSPCPGSSEIAPVARMRFECPSQPGYYADPQNGRWFFACMDLGGPELMAYEFRCPYGLVFDEQKLVCEWPWLVAGYSDSRTYDSRGYGAGSTQGAGGYVTSGSSDGYSGSAGGHGGYSGSAGVHGGYSGSAGVHGGYSGSTGVHGGYSGTATGGISGGNSGGSGFSGAAGVGYSGSSGGAHGSAFGHEYTGSTGEAHGSSFGQGYGGAAGTGYTGSTDGIQGASFGHGYAGSTGAGYSGSTGSANVGSVDGSYSGSVGSGYTGLDGTGYSGSAGGAYSGSAGHAGSGTSGYSGSSGNSIYSGATGVTHGGTIGSGYTGSNDGYSGSTYVSQGGAGYSGTQTGSTDYSQGGYSGGYSGSAGGGYSGSSDGKYSGSTAGDNIGSSGYSGTSGISSSTVGSGYSSGSFGGTKGGYSGIDHSNSGGYSGTGSTYAGATGGGYAGSSQGGYSAQSGTQYGGSSGTDYSQAGFSSGPTIVAGSVSPQAPTTLIGQELPSVSYIPGASGDGQGYVTSGQVTGHGISTGSLFPGQPGVTTTYYGNTGGGSFTNDVSGQGNVHSTIYQSGVKGGYSGSGNRNNLNVTLYGSGPPSLGNTVYHGGIPSTGYGITGSVGTGAIVTGNSIQGSIVTDDSSSGTLITHGDTSGTVLAGSADQGSILTGGSQPGYTKTGAGTQGYVISGGVRTEYQGSASPGTIVHGTPSHGILLNGTPAPGTIIGGEQSPGLILTGQTSPGVSLGGSIDQGTVVGSTGNQYFSQTGFSTYGEKVATTIGSTYTGTINAGGATYDTGYKTNEYHDNGGRGTIKFNNGYVTSKYTENDIPDYRPAGGPIPDSIITGDRVEASGASFGTTSSGVQTQTSGYPSGQSGSLTPSGFTKTGPTKTGITTATLGGRGSYVISTGKPRPPLNPDHIGEKAFEGNVVGYTKTSTESNVLSYSTQSQDVSHIDSSKITLGPTGSTGYSYPKPSIPFVTGDVPAYSPASVDGNILTATTPAPFLNVEVYNTPRLVDSAPITASPAVVNTYSYDKPAKGQYDESVFDSSRIPTGFTTRRPPTPTITPIIYTTGSVENYKTTLFEAAKIPVVISTVQPVTDTGYKTVTVKDDRYSNSFQGGFGERNDYFSVTTSSPTKSRPISVPTVTYEPPTVTVRSQVNYASSTASPGGGYSYGPPKSGFELNVTPSSIAEPVKPQTQYLPADSVSPAIGVTYRKPFPVPGITYQQSTPQPAVTPVNSKAYGYSGSSSSSYSGQGQSIGAKTTYGGSPTNLDIPRGEVGKLITNYDRGSTKYVPSGYDTYSGTTTSSISNEFSRKQSSFSSQSYGSSTSGSFGRTERPGGVTTSFGGYSKPSSVEVSTRPTSVGRGKVIVKWSDLHPLLLNKLGAECTCRADPFATLRGPGSKKIASSKGQVDLANYDESEVYVDLEKEGSYEDDDYVTNYESSSRGPVKVWNSIKSASLGTDSQTRGKPSSTYLPSVSTPAPSAGLHGRVPPREYGVPESSSTPSSRDYNFAHRSGKNLNNAKSSTNSIATEGTRGSDEIIQETSDCARPGLFRHPNFCNKFYACHWDEWKKKFTLHVFNCPVHLTFDISAGACNWPSKGPACQDDNLLV